MSALFLRLPEWAFPWLDAGLIAFGAFGFVMLVRLANARERAKGYRRRTRSRGERGRIMSTASPIAGRGGVVGSPGAIFNAAYYNSWPPLKQPLFNGRPGAQGASLPALSVMDRIACVLTCIKNRIAIDEEIDYDPDVDPYTTQYMREFVYGQKWEPCGTGNVESTEVIQQGEYSGVLPAGVPQVDYLIVTTDPAKYPPFPVPVVVPVVPVEAKAANPIGARIIPEVPQQPNSVGGVFRCAVANDGYPTDGTGIWEGTSGQFTGTWTKQALEEGLMIVWTKTA